MNSAVITKIEYRLISNPVFSQFDIIPNSAKLTEDIDRTRAGNLYRASSQFNIAKISTENDSLLNSIRNLKAQFRLTDANGSIHLVGNENFPARITYQKALDGTPGSFNGYRCTITCNSPSGSSVS